MERIHFRITPMTNKFCLVAFIALFTVSLSVHAESKLNVVTTTEDLAAIAREVGGDHITVDSIAKGYQDPHFVEAKPSFILKLQKANLLILVGRDLEIGWLPALIQQSRNSKIQVGADGYLDASLHARILDIPQDLINQMKKANVKIVLVEPYFDLKTPNSIGRATGAEVLVMPPSVGGVKEASDYFKLFDYDLNLLINAMKKTSAN